MKPAFKLLSPETGTEYSIYVEAPPVEEQIGPWPVVLFMDGDDQFSAAVSAYHEARKAGTVPSLLLAGVGYGASYAKAANKRGRDYTPTAHSDEPTSGGAGAFMKFLTKTLWPELAQHFPLDNKKRAIAGHSLGSLLALYALWQEPLFFTHYLVSAPSIWWDDRSVLNLVTKRYASSPNLTARLFLSVGEKDSASMNGDLARLERQLLAKPFHGLDVTVRLFARKNHFNVLPDAFGAGLSYLFGPA